MLVELINGIIIKINNNNNMHRAAQLIKIIIHKIINHNIHAN